MGLRVLSGSSLVRAARWADVDRATVDPRWGWAWHKAHLLLLPEPYARNAIDGLPLARNSAPTLEHSRYGPGLGTDPGYLSLPLVANNFPAFTVMAFYVVRENPGGFQGLWSWGPDATSGGPFMGFYMDTTNVHKMFYAGGLPSAFNFTVSVGDAIAVAMSDRGTGNIYFEIRNLTARTRLVVTSQASSTSGKGNGTSMFWGSGYAGACTSTFLSFGLWRQALSIAQIDRLLTDPFGPFRLRSSVSRKAPVGGTTYNQGVAGGFTPGGALAKQTARILAGGATPAGALVKSPSRGLAGSLTSSGVVVKLTSRALVASTTPTGALVKRTFRALAGSVASSGALAAVKTFLRSVAGAIAPSGSLRGTALKSLAAALTPSGTVQRAMTRALGGLVTPSGIVAKQTRRALAGVASFAGAVSSAFALVYAGLRALFGGGLRYEVSADLHERYEVTVELNDRYEVAMSVLDEDEV